MSPHSPSSRFLLAGALLLGGSLLPTLAFAQNEYLDSAEVETCNIEGQASLTILGITSHYPIACVNPSARSTAGTDASNLVGTQVINLPVVSNIATASAPLGESIYGLHPDTTVLASQTALEDVTLVQDMVEAEVMAAQLQCYVEEASTVVKCIYYMGLGSLAIDGDAVSLPPNPIPLNYQIPVSHLSLALNLGGLPVVVTNLAGTVTLNQIHSSLTPLAFEVEHVPISVDLHGSVSVLGLGLVQVAVQVRDPERQLFAVKADVSALYALTNKAFEGVERLVELNQECVGGNECPVP